jgi:hypothetical protein
VSAQDRNEGKAGISDLTVIAFITSFLLPLVGWILGFRARKQIVDSEGRFTGRPFATAAIWIGGILTSAWIAMFAMMGISAHFNDNGFGWAHHTSMHQRFIQDNTGDNGYSNGFNNGFRGGMMGQQFDPNQDGTSTSGTNNN